MDREYNESEILSFVAPKSFKKGTLILGMFTIKDVLVIATVGGITFLSFLTYAVTTERINILILFLFFIPLLVLSIFYIPLNHFHNTSTFLKLFIQYATRKKKYIYGGVRYAIYSKK